MSKISILDCTLRDGGYINQWRFGRTEIRDIISHLCMAGIDIIECGFLRDLPYSEDQSVFSCVSQITPFITPKRENTLYVAMIALGDISPDKLLPCDGTSIDGIRLTFHKHEWQAAREAAVTLMNKGYRVFIQPVGTTSYSDSELLRLIADVNELRPFAFFLVDTLGILYRKDLLRSFFLIDHNLDPAIKVGFHSHNNLQLSFANAQELLRADSKRELIIDASVYGMGRGVGNLCSELLAEYINVNMEQRYHLTPLLTVADQYLMSIYAEQRWGYDIPYFLSAAKKCHPNYAAYLLKKGTLKLEDISKLLSMLPPDQRDLYHPELVEQLYMTLQSYQIDDTAALTALTEQLRGRRVLLLAPGAALKTHQAEIDAYILRCAPVTIAVNFIPQQPRPDMLFVSNRKRLQLLLENGVGRYPVVASSNLRQELPDTVTFINYTSYLGDGEAADNAGAMLIRLLAKVGAAHVALAGFDGFAVDSADNYCIDSYKAAMDQEAVKQKNRAISQQLKLALQGIPYDFITPTRYTF